MSLSREQVDALLTPLDGRRVKVIDGQSHLEAWDVRRHLLRVFGWGGWDFSVVSCDCILERSVWTSEKPDETHKGRHTVAYRVIGRLTIKDRDGQIVAVFEDGATGDARNQPTFSDAHDMALKTAMSQALKRCAMNLGDRFGLSLYNKRNDGSAVVGRTVAHEHDELQAAIDEAVEQEQEPVRQGAEGKPASTPPIVGEGGEGASNPPVDPPAPASDPLAESVEIIDAIQADLPAAKRKNLRAWAVAYAMPIASDGTVDSIKLTLEQAEQVLEHLTSIQQPVSV